MAEERPSGDAGATVAASPDARRRAADGGDPRPSPDAASHVTAARAALAHTTALVLRTDEAARALALSRALVILTGVGLLALPFLYDPTRVLYWPMAGTVAVLFAASVLVWRRSRGERGHSRATFRAYIWLSIVSGLFVEYDLGVFSPAPLFLTLGVTFLAQSNDRRLALGATVFSAGSYFVLALLVAAGVVPDLGLLHVMGASGRGRGLMVVIVPIAFAVAAWQGRQARRATLAAIEQSHEALRLAITREAQLAEANHDLDVALRAGAGEGGRYSSVVMGRFRLGEIVGRGAMGEIYAAADVESGEPAAVKVLQAAVSRQPDLVERFLREGRITARLRAPNVVTVFEVGAAAGVPFIAMELLVGQDLSAHLRQKERLDLPAVVDLCAEVARGLGAAHGAGVVHRDIKPQNIFHAEQGLGQRPVWKILDFGVSKLRDSSATLTNAAVVGTPGYMSPEQAEGRDADHRSDVFALGAVVYRALTGRPPFSGDLPHVLFEIVYKSPIRPSELLPALPPDVDLVLALALAKRAEDRFDSAAELAAALRDAGHGALDPALRARASRLLETASWESLLDPV
jgi:eukaryotic-like serine/threonine-protein kinase